MDELLRMYKNLQDMMINIGEVEGRTETCYKNYKEKLGEVDKKKNEVGFGTYLKVLLPVLVAIIMTIFGFMMLIDGDDARIACLFFWAIAMIFWGLTNIIYNISYNRHDREPYLQESKVIYFNEVVPLYVKYKESADELNGLYRDEEYLEMRRHIPDAYCSIEIIQFFIDAIEQKRVDSQKELYQLYDQYEHQRKMEELEQERLRKIEESRVHCPKCNSTDCMIITKTTTDVTPFGFGDACCGMALLGPIGILCGTCGMGSKTETKMLYHCNQCGKDFSL